MLIVIIPLFSEAYDKSQTNENTHWTLNIEQLPITQYTSLVINTWYANNGASSLLFHQFTVYLCNKSAYIIVCDDAK